MYFRRNIVMDNLQIWRKLRKISLDDIECVGGVINMPDDCTLLSKKVNYVTITDNEDEIQVKFEYIDSPTIFTVENLPHDEFRYIAESIYYQLRQSYTIGDFEEDFIPMCHTK